MSILVFKTATWQENALIFISILANTVKTMLQPTIRSAFRDVKVAIFHITKLFDISDINFLTLS